MDPLRWAKFFAATKHGNQQYSSGLPYTHHLAQVEAVLCRREFVFHPFPGHGHCYGADPDDEMLQAAWLHDVVEDTTTKLKEISEMFGDRVAELVGAVTNEPGPNRKTRHALTYPKIRSVKGAVRLKLADRIANVEAGGKLVEMYQKEYEDFKRNLYTPGECEAMWKHLDGLLL